MGEMADYYLDQLFDTDQQQLENTEPEEDNDGGHHPVFTYPKTITCRCCGTTGLTWGIHNSKWRLHKGPHLHHCPTNPLKEHPTTAPPEAPKSPTQPPSQNTKNKRKRHGNKKKALPSQKKTTTKKPKN